MDWNLILSGFPRSITIKHPALSMYNQHGLSKAHNDIAQSIVDAFEKITHEETFFSSYEKIFSSYQHVITMCEAGLEQMISLQSLHEIIMAKIEKKIYMLSKYSPTTFAACSSN